MITMVLQAGWQCVGFTHGVLNTDNISLLGLTIDYGPYGFMEHFDPDYVPNGSDGTGRYRYSDQPAVSDIKGVSCSCYASCWIRQLHDTALL